MSEPAPEPLPELMVTPHAERLLECLCTQLALSLGGSTCMCCLRPGGALPPMDACHCDCTSGANGQASVQVTDIFPSAKFPRRSVDEWDEVCDARVTWVGELTMTVYRCVSSLEADGAAPTCEQLERDFRRIQSDAAAMRRAFACCDWSDGRRKLPAGWTPVPPKGGCAGGFMTVFVDLGALCCPEETP